MTADFYCDTTFSGEVCDCTGNARGVCGSYEQCEEDQVFGWVTIPRARTRNCDNCGCGQCTGWTSWANWEWCP